VEAETNRRATSKVEAKESSEISSSNCKEGSHGWLVGFKREFCQADQRKDEGVVGCGIGRG
jgi:hypothetical protein